MMTRCATFTAAAWFMLAGCTSIHPVAVPLTDNDIINEINRRGHQEQAVVTLADGRSSAARFLYLVGDSIGWWAPYEGRHRRMAQAEVAQIRLERTERAREKGFVAGVLIGAAAGALIGLASGAGPPPEQPFALTFTAEQKAKISGAMFGVLGGLIGTAVGIPDQDIYTFGPTAARPSSAGNDADPREPGPFWRRRPSPE